MRQRQARIPWARFAAISVTAVGLLIAGCGDGRLATYPVTGTVLVDGQPAPKAILVFCPVEDQNTEALMRLRPAGETGPDGRYQLTTYKANDGAPAGQYQVMVRWEAASWEGTEAARPARGKRPPDRLRGRYMNPQTSGLAATVEARATEILPFELKTR